VNPQSDEQKELVKCRDGPASSPSGPAHLRRVSHRLRESSEGATSIAVARSEAERRFGKAACFERKLISDHFFFVGGQAQSPTLVERFEYPLHLDSPSSHKLQSDNRNEMRCEMSRC